MQITGEKRCVFIQIISENISLSHGSLFQASEHFKVSYSKQAQVLNTLYKRQSILAFMIELRILHSVHVAKVDIKHINHIL